MEENLNDIEVDGYHVDINSAPKEQLNSYLDKTYEKVCDIIKEQNRLIELMITKEENQ